MSAVDTLSVFVVVLLLAGQIWAHRAVRRVVRRSNELIERSKARQAYVSEREAARAPMRGAAR